MMSDKFVPRTNGVASGEWLAMWTNGEVRALYEALQRLYDAGIALDPQSGMWHEFHDALKAAELALGRARELR